MIFSFFYSWHTLQNLVALKYLTWCQFTVQFWVVYLFLWLDWSLRQTCCR